MCGYIELFFADSVDEFDAFQQFENVLMTSKLSPALGRTFGQLKHHHQAGFSTAVAFRFLCLKRIVANVLSIGLVVRMWHQLSAGKS